MLIGYVVKLGMVIVLYIYMYTQNKKRDREAGDMTVEEERLAIEQGMQDQTELDNKGFRYTL
jgi:DhnA family fructose-bisphosphate aldolase class Ia